jgi:hypothetical protein
MSASRLASEGPHDERDWKRGQAEPGTSSYEPTRSWVKFDRFAFFQLGRIHCLPDKALWLLAALCMLADRRTGFVRTTITELHKDCRIGRDTVPKMLAALETAGVVNITRPFGPHVEGELEIVAWSDIVVEAPREKAMRLAYLNKRQNAEKARINSGSTAEKSANDQGKRQHRGQEGGKEVWDSGEGKVLSEEDWGPRQCGALSEVNWDSYERDVSSASYAVVEPDEAIASVRLMDDTALSSSEAVKVSPNPRCPDCGGWLEPPLPEGEDWCLCDWNGQ